MKERPILFNGEMVRAILDGRKTQTRRLMKPQPTPIAGSPGCWEKKYSDGSIFPFWDGTNGSTDTRWQNVCPLGGLGDRLWVRETFAHITADESPDQPDTFVGEDRGIHSEYSDTGKFRTRYAATPPEVISWEGGWRPSIHMPRWASRTTLEVTAVRVERLQDISEDDARAEGFGIDTRYCKSSPRVHFSATWEKIYGLQSWIDNPWVWVIEFRRLQ